MNAIAAALSPMTPPQAGPQNGRGDAARGGEFARCLDQACESEPPEAPEASEEPQRPASKARGARDAAAPPRVVVDVTIAAPIERVWQALRDPALVAQWFGWDYDKLVDEAFVTDPRDTEKMKTIFRKAMEIWLPDLPDIQLVQNIHRIPMNTTYWTNWPTAENPIVNGASWHLTHAMVLWNLKPVG